MTMPSAMGAYRKGDLMTEIEKIKKLVESSVTVFVAQDKNEKGIVLTKHSLFYLITTIESQQGDISKKGLANDMLLLSFDAIVRNSREQLTVEYARAQATAARKLLEGDK